ncbi:MAG: 4Fe-4S binding protein [Nitrosomonadales bacterium]|nr:4Fe-4S binding protein [Nitrosomonadales bacterium]
MSKKKFHFPRRAVQIATLLIIALIPAVGLFRIDLASASFHVLDRQIWWSNFAFIFGLSIVLVAVPILSYVTISAVWCGWACPQNLLVEWANNLTHQFLGKRADVRVDGRGLVVAHAKNKAFNWLILGTTFLVASLALALIPVLYFLPPGDVWDFITFSANNQVTSFITFPYFFIALLIFIDMAFARYFFCDYACFYRVGQIIFNNKNALHIRYDASRSPDCAKCNYCATSCITGIQPTDIKSGDRCIGCGECVDACNQLHEKSATVGLLCFQAGSAGIGKPGGKATWQQTLTALSTRFNWVIGIFAILGLVMMGWGVLTQKPPPRQLSAGETQQAQRIEQVCNNQCAAFTTSCTGHSMEGCYRASACKCACNLQQDPGNAAGDSWHQCVIRYTALADKLGKRDKRP